MKRTLSIIVAAASSLGLAAAEPPLIVVRPVAPVAVTPPSAGTTSASNQAVLTQIINRLNQSRTDHAIAIASAPKAVQPVVQPVQVQVGKSR